MYVKDLTNNFTDSTGLQYSVNTAFAATTANITIVQQCVVVCTKNSFHNDTIDHTHFMT